MTTEKLREKTENKTPKASQAHSPSKNGENKVAGLTKKKPLKLPVLLKPGEIGYIVAEIPILPGCISQGKTQEEALANIKEAAELYLSGGPLPVVLNQYILTEVAVTI
jgi:predicted RNase H-like HicB family nuclease